RDDLVMEDNGVRTGRKKWIQEESWIYDHEVNLKRQARDGPEPMHDHRPHAQVWDEVAVHHIDVDSSGAAQFALMDLLTQAGEIGGKDGRCNVNHDDLPGVRYMACSTSVDIILRTRGGFPCVLSIASTTCSAKLRFRMRFTMGPKPRGRAKIFQ